MILRDHPSFIRSDLLAMLLTGFWLVAWRALLGTTWGFHPAQITDGLVDVGILYNPGDTWSYLSWAQQYFHGSNLAGLLYTTEPNAPLLWIFPLWLVGKTAAWLGLPLIGIYNASGLVGAMAAVYLFRRAARALALPTSACNWATVALVLGSGSSWLLHLASKFHLAPSAVGGDLFYFDLFPSTAFLTYAYHAVGLALLAGLWWTVTESENRLHEGRPARIWIVALIIFALLLSFSRPYEPVAFMGAWMLKTGWHGWQRSRFPQAWHASLRLAVILGVTLAPGVVWNVWVTQQPGWSYFAHATLVMAVSRSVWVWTLIGGAPLALLGAVALWRRDQRLAVLPLSAALLFGFILFVLGVGFTKMASGLILGPILLIGQGVICLNAQAIRVPRFARVFVVGLVIIGSLGLPSYYLAVRTIQYGARARIPAEFLHLSSLIGTPHEHQPVHVLTDNDSGAILPGLIGCEVWVGHWSLSPNYWAKVATLARAGLDPNHQPADPTSANAELATILASAPFDCALLERRCVTSIQWLEAQSWSITDSTPNWVLLRPRDHPVSH